MKKIISMILVFLMVFGMAGCSKAKDGQEGVERPVAEKSWDEILEESKGTTVNFYGWGGSDKINKWLDEEVASELKEKYDITFNRVPMNIDEIINKLLGEKQGGLDDGTIDIVWINGENFYTAKQAELLYGPFEGKLPNFEKYLDGDSLEVKYDFGFEVNGYEVPYGKAQFVMIGDQSVMESLPKDHLELMEIAKANKGKITYPAPPDFTGSAFIRNIIYDIVGYEKFMDMEADKETVRAEIQPAIDYFNELKPYLWREGKTYPSSLAQLDNMYSDEETIMTMNYNPMHASSMIEQGRFSDTSQTFLFEKGTLGNTHFLAIPFNASNKEAAMVVINEIIGPKLQASKYDPLNWGDLPVTDNSKLDDAQKAVFDGIDLGQGVLKQSELLENRMIEMPADIVPIIEEIWTESVLEGE